MNDEEHNSANRKMDVWKVIPSFQVEKLSF